MSIVSKSPEQDNMDRLPQGQDIFADGEALTSWTRGPFPIRELEQAALKIFGLKYANSDWVDPRMSIERNACRKLALQLRVDFLKLDSWTIETAAPNLADELADLIFGDRRLGKTIREEVAEYCEAFIADAWGHFGKRLVYPRDVAANTAEVASEDSNG